MILADTSVWIGLLNGRLAKRVSADDLLRLVTCGPVVQEVVQGLRIGPEGDAVRQALSAMPCLSDPLPVNTFLEAAEIYRTGRGKGYAIRAAADCLIAAIAIANRVPVWHQDRDFSVIAKYTSLTTMERLERLQ
jgi:predicted nucleic acid-binding protein